MIDSANCKFCTGVRDTPEHTFFECSRFVSEKNKIDTELGITLTPDNIVKEMTENKLKWKQISEFIQRILITKQKIYNNKVTVANPLPPQPMMYRLVIPACLESQILSLSIILDIIFVTDKVREMITICSL